MTTFEESDLRITVNAPLRARKFDDNSHGLRHCMKAADFVIESENVRYFIEIKDQNNPKAIDLSAINRFKDDLKSGIFVNKPVSKCRDSYIYVHLNKKLHKAVVYLVLLLAKHIGPPEYLAQTDTLKRMLPINGRGDIAWKEPFIKRCIILNMEHWNRFVPGVSITRISAIT